MDPPDAVFEGHLQKLESNELAVFSCQSLFQRMHSDGNYNYLQDNHLKERIERALERATRIHHLYWVLGWKEDAPDGIVQFLSRSVSLYEVTLLAPHPQERTLTSYLQAVAHNPYHHLQTLRIHTAYLPLSALCQSLLIPSKTLRVLDLKGRASPDDEHRFTMSLVDLNLFAEALAQNTSLKELQLEGIHLETTAPEATTIAASTYRRSKKQQQSQNSSIQRLIIESCRFDSPLAAQTFMNAFGAVQTIHLQGNKGLESWIYQLYKPPSTLTSLQAANFAFPKGKWVQKFLQNPNNLQNYSIGASEASYLHAPTYCRRFWEHLGQSLGNNSSLTTLNITSPISNDFLPTPLTSTQLTSLSVLLHPPIPLYFLAHLASPQCRLRALRLQIRSNDEAHSPWISLQQLCTALGQNQSLQEVDLQLWDTATADIPRDRIPWPQFTNLRRFSVTQCQAPPEFFEDLFRGLLLSNSNNLTDLELGWMTWSDRSVDLLCEFLRHSSCRLDSLWLHGGATNTRGYRQTTGRMTRLFEALTENASLRSFRVSCTLVDLKDAVAFHLPQLTAMQYLVLSIEYDGGIHNNALESSATTSHRAIQTDFLQALGFNKSLCHVKVQGVLDPYEHWFSSWLTFYGLRNQVNTLFASRSGELPPPGLWPYLLLHLQRKEWCPSILFYVLVQSADLLWAAPHPIPAPQPRARNRDNYKSRTHGCGRCLRRFRWR